MRRYRGFHFLNSNNSQIKQYVLKILSVDIRWTPCLNIVLLNNWNLCTYEVLMSFAELSKHVSQMSDLDEKTVICRKSFVQNTRTQRNSVQVITSLSES